MAENYSGSICLQFIGLPVCLPRWIAVTAKTMKHDVDWYCRRYCCFFKQTEFNHFSYSLLLIHPSLDNPQKKNKKTHLGDPNIDQEDGVGYPKTFETKSS